MSPRDSSLAEGRPLVSILVSLIVMVVVEVIIDAIDAVVAAGPSSLKELLAESR